MSPEGNLVIEVCGEGTTDVGKTDGPDNVSVQPPTSGVVPILTRALCGKPSQMLVKPRKFVVLEGRGLWKKVLFAKRRARRNKSAGVVFVVDSEGNLKDLSKKKRQLTKGRDFELPDLPTAIGVAHPCIEAWLLADAAAIRRGLELTGNLQVPDKPVQLPAPRLDKQKNPKTELARAAGSAKKELAVKQKDRIAAAMNDMELVRKRCPQGFVPFADEVREHIVPLFLKNTQPRNPP